MVFMSSYDCVILCDYCNREFKLYYDYYNDISGFLEREFVKDISCCFCDSILIRKVRFKEVSLGKYGHKRNGCIA
jgi:hypothetical protein